MVYEDDRLIIQGRFCTEEFIIMKNKTVYLFIALLFLLILAACSSQSVPNYKKELNKDSMQKILQEKPIEKFLERDPSITLSAIGDILIHDRVYEVAETDKGYDFMPFLENVAPYLDDTTITFANQESIIGGEEIGLSNYPAFNSPYEVGDALKKVGVDIVSMANNHTLDRGEQAIQNAITHWDDIDMLYTGSYKDQADRDDIRVMDTQAGISVAFLAYTYGTNGITVPSGKEYLVNFIDEETMETDIALAKEKADVVILSLHFGIEYEPLPSEEQQDLVQFAADEEVDIVLGHHPHVLQPIEWVEGTEGNETLAVYSLGNFLSGQEGLDRQIGGIFKCTITKVEEDGEERIDISALQFMPTYIEYGEWEPTPMFELTDQELPDAAEHYNDVKEHMSQFIPTLEFIEE